MNIQKGDKANTSDKNVMIYGYYSLANFYLFRIRKWKQDTNCRCSMLPEYLCIVYICMWKI